MDIVQENKNDLEAVIKIHLTEEDYKDKVEKGLKEMQKTAKIAGFRPGKVPMGMIKKMYGKGVKADEINKVLVDAVYDYIKEQNLDVLGSPLPNHDDVADIDWDNQTEFNMSYEIGLAPKVDFELNDKIKVEHYKIKPTKKILDEQILELRRRYGKMSSPEISEKDDVLFGEFIEMENDEQEKENGVRNKANLFIQYIKDEKVRKEFLGLKSGDFRVFEPLKATESDVETANMLGVKKEQLNEIGPKFKFVVDKISRIEPAELNEDFYKKIAPDADIKDEAAFREFVAEQIEKQYQLDADKHFKNEAMKKILDKVKLPIPEEFMKRWLYENNKDKMSKEDIEKDFPNYADSFRWQLIENQIIKNNNIEVSQEEVKDHLREYMKMQLKQYGQENPEDSVVEEFVNRMLSQEEEIKKVYEKLFDDKVLELLKSKLKIKSVDISIDDFIKLVTEKYNKKK
ncbi:MAG: trigger factor [Bacteroidales bacterium]